MSDFSSFDIMLLHHKLQTCFVFREIIMPAKFSIKNNNVYIYIAKLVTNIYINICNCKALQEITDLVHEMRIVYFQL